MKKPSTMKSSKKLIFLFLTFCFVTTYSQNIGINSTGATPNSSAMLDIDVSGLAAKKGLLIPRMTLSQISAMNPLPAPAQGLIVYQTDGQQGFYYNTSTTTTPSWTYLLSANGTTGGWKLDGNFGTTPGTDFIGTTDATDLVFKTQGLEKMRITTSGKVGIDENNPTSSLQVRTYKDGLLLTPFDGLKLTSPYHSNVYQSGAMFGIDDGSINGIMGTNAQLWNFENGFLKFGTNNTEQLRITSTGQFGIHESNPSTTLTVRPYHNGVGGDIDGIQIVHPTLSPSSNSGFLLGVDNSSSGYDAHIMNYQNGFLNFGTNGSERMRITPVGTVAIGTTNPSSTTLATLVLNDNSAAHNGMMVLNPMVAPGTQGMHFGLEINNPIHGRIWNYMNGDIEFGTNNIELMRLSYNGNIGIGTTSPTEKLEVSGKIKTTEFQLTSGAFAGAVLVSDPGGNATWQTPSANAWGLTGNSGTVDGTNFIGTTDDVPLNFRVNNQKAGRIDHINKNLFLGMFAGDFNSNATNNVALGDSAMAHSGGNHNSVAIGNNSIKTCIACYDNVSIGFEALKNGWVDTDYNVAIGSGAMREGGSYAIGIGFQAMYKGGTSGSTAIGHFALYNSIWGFDNTAIGYGTMNKNINGSYNSTLGASSLVNNIVGNSNTAIGKETLKNTNASKNTAIGDSAGFANTTGTLNTFIGYQANGSATITNATAIGANANVTASNSLVLGNNVNVGIGTTAPTEKLDVVGKTKTSTLQVTTGATAGNVLTSDASGNATWQANGNGTVTSIAFAMPSLFSVSGSPVTSSGTITTILATQNANTIFAGPSSGAAAAPTFRAMVAADIPSGSTYYIQNNAVGNNFATGQAASFDITGDAEINGTLEVNGNVGIGTTAPSEKLDVIGKTKTSTLQVTTGAGTTGQVLTSDALGNATWQTNGNGTVTSVALSMPTIFSVSGSPVSSSGTLTASLATQSANTIFAGPSSGGAASPTFRTLVAADIPTGAAGYIQNNTVGANFATGQAASFDITGNGEINGTLNINGNVGIGNIAPSAKLEVTNTSGGGITEMIVNSNGTTDADFILKTTNTNMGWFGGGAVNKLAAWNYANNTEPLTILGSNGNVGIGVTTPTQKLHVSGNGLFTGTVTASCGVLACSDIRYKKNINPLTNSLQKILLVNGVNYNFKQDEFPEKNFSSKKQIGFIAQDLELIFPELVEIDDNGFKTVDYSKITPVLVEAIKEQQKIIDEDKTKMTEMQAMMNLLNKRLSALENSNTLTAEVKNNE